MTHLKENLKALRKAKGGTGVTQDEAAAGIGLKKTTYANYENGHSNPGIDELVKISKYFVVSIDELLNTDIDFTNKLKSSVGEKVPGSKYQHVSISPVIREADEEYNTSTASELFYMFADRLKKMEEDIAALAKGKKK